MEPQIEKFFSEAHRRSYDRGKAEGEAKGEAKGTAEALLMFLKRRGLAMTSDQQHRIITCTDLATLDRWLDRAFRSPRSRNSSPNGDVAAMGASLASEAPHVRR